MLWLLVVLPPVGSALGDSAAVAKEATSTAPAPVSVAFLSAEEARAAIVDDSLEPYFDLLQPMEMSAKTGAAIVVLDTFIPEQEVRPGTRRSVADKALAPMRKWFRQNLSQKPEETVRKERQPAE